MFYLCRFRCLRCFDAVDWAAALHIAQLMPLPLTVSCFSKIQIGSTFLVPAHLGSRGERAVKWVCVYIVVQQWQKTNHTLTW